MALDCPAHPFHPGQHPAAALTLPYSTSSSAATLASIDNDEHPAYLTNLLEHTSSMQCFPTSHLRGTPYQPPSPAASTSSSMTSSSVTPPSQKSCPSSPTSSVSSSSSSSPSLHTHILDLYSKYAPVPDDEYIPGVRAADGLMTANHPAVRAFLDLAAASPHDLPPPPKEAATFALCALASISTPLHPAHWVFWRESRRTWTSAVVDRVITYRPPLIVIPRDISWLGPEENRCILWLYQSRMRDVYPTLTWWCDSYHPRKQEEGQSERRTRSATAAAATSSTANAGATPASSSSKSKAKSGGRSRQRAGTVTEDQKQQSQKRVEDETKSEAQNPEKSQPKQADVAVAVAAGEEKVHAGQKRKTPPSSSPSLSEDTTEGNEVDAGASSAPAKKRARPAMGGKELRALAQAAHFATSGLGRSAHAFAGVSADMFSAASGSSSSSSPSSSQPSSSASSKPSSKKAGDESSKAAEEEESPAQATRVSARQRERRDRAVAAVSTTSTAPVAKKTGNNKHAPSSPSALAASPLSECTPLALSTSISGEQRSPSALATSIDAASNVETENDKEEEEAMNLIPPLLPTPASLPRELPTSKRRSAGNGKSNSTTATISSGSGNSNKSNSRTRTRRPSHHERSTSNASTTLSSSSSNTFSSAASVSGESTHTLVTGSAALHGRSRSRSLSGQSDVSEATTAVGEQQPSHKRGKVVEEEGVPLDSVLFKPVSDLEEEEDLGLEGGEQGPDEREARDNDESGPGRRRREQASMRSSSSSRSRSRSSKRTARPSPKKALLIDEAAAAAVTAAAKKRAARARR